ncbi:MAG TPA: hypothetical protein VIB79_15895 [Candidatus Binatia bacterium]|jgi:translation initiation factor IF-1
MQRYTTYSKYLLAAVTAAALCACAPVETRPTLNEARTTRVDRTVASDSALQPGEIRGEVMEVLPDRHEIRVRTDSGRDRILAYDTTRTRVSYHGWDYTVDNLEAGDIIAFRTMPRDGNYVDTIRVYEPVQARTTPRSNRPVARANVIEGTVERVQYDLGTFDVRTRSGDLVTVSIPFRASNADIDNFRRLRNGDYVRVEGEYVNRDNLQLYSFLAPR